MLALAAELLESRLVSQICEKSYAVASHLFVEGVFKQASDIILIHNGGLPRRSHFLLGLERKFSLLEPTLAGVEVADLLFDLGSAPVEGIELVTYTSVFARDRRSELERGDHV